MEPPCVGSNPTTPASLKESLFMLSRNVKIGLLCVEGVSAAIALVFDVGNTIKSILIGVAFVTVILALMKIGGC